MRTRIIWRATSLTCGAGSLLVGIEPRLVSARLESPLTHRGMFDMTLTQEMRKPGMTCM